MKESYLEVTYRHGHPLAAYLYLPREPGDKSERTEAVQPGIIVDFTQSGKAIGVEITAPTKVTAATLNSVLNDLGVPLVTGDDLAPLQAA